MKHWCTALRDTNALGSRSENQQRQSLVVMDDLARVARMARTCSRLFRRVPVLFFVMTAVLKSKSHSTTGELAVPTQAMASRAPDSYLPAAHAADTSSYSSPPAPRRSRWSNSRRRSKHSCLRAMLFSGALFCRPPVTMHGVDGAWQR
jgi:hypothetical protein